MLSKLFKTACYGVEEDLRTSEAGKGSVKDNMDDMRDILEDEILASKSSDEEKRKQLRRLRTFCDTETNIMLVGATGCGKSSTINALFAVGKGNVIEDEEEGIEASDSRCRILPQVEVAKVGSKVDPETRDIEKYTIGNLILWDTPGLGDGTEDDEHHRAVITELLRERDENGNALIDLVLLVLDGSTKDLGTSYHVLNDVIIPELGEETERILVALNQADIAMKTGRHWNYEKNEPDDVLIDYLNKKVQSIRKRINEESGLNVEPVYYCAGYEEEGGDVVWPYNLSKLLYYIMRSLPPQKRVAVMEGINCDSENYEYNDDSEDYNEEIKDCFYDSFDYISDGVEKGAELGGEILGIPGMIAGAFFGGFVGCMKTVLDEIFD